MAIGNLYVHSADGRVEAYWTGGAGTGTLEYSLDSGGLSGWTVASSSITGTNNHYAHTLANSTTARWWRYSEGGAPITFADAAYAHSGTFKDVNGRSVVPLGVGCKCIFIAASGSTPAGDNSNDGLGVATPKLTFASARGSFSAGDAILFKRGATFSVTSIDVPASGASTAKISVIGAYGPRTSGRASLSYSGYGIDGGNRQRFAVLDLSVDCPSRTDDNPSGLFFGLITGGTDSVLIEESKFSGGLNGIIGGGSVGNVATNVVIRRCVVANNYPHSGNHSQGILLYSCDSPLVEDCLLINNGFLASDPTTYPNTIFNHNLYMSESNSNATVTNVLAIGNDCQCRSGGTYSRIFVVQSPLGINTAAITGLTGSYVAQSSTIQDCLVDGSCDLDGTTARGWGYTLGATDHGTTETITLKDCLLNLTSLDGGTTVGTQLSQVSWDRPAAGGNSGTLIIDGCVFARAQVAFSQGALTINDPPYTLRVVDTVFDMAGTNPCISYLDTAPTTQQYGGNTYWSNRAGGTSISDSWFVNVTANNGRTFATWLSYTGDPYSGYSASTENGSAVSFSAVRRATDYCTHIGVTATVAGLTSACEAQGASGTWDPNLTAEYAIDWIRQGYGMPALLGGGTSALPPTVQNQVPLMWRRLHNHRRHR